MNWIRGLLLNIIFALALSIGEDNDCIREEKPAAVYWKLPGQEIEVCGQVCLIFSKLQFATCSKPTQGKTLNFFGLNLLNLWHCI
jgi:hypothetical protein